MFEVQMMPYYTVIGQEGVWSFDAESEGHLTHTININYRVCGTGDPKINMTQLGGN